MLRNPKNIAIAALAVIVVIDEAVIIPLNNRRANKAIAKQGALITYLGDLLDKNGVQISEFDKIAMSEIAAK